jgi:hypothetical protein
MLRLSEACPFFRFATVRVTFHIAAGVVAPSVAIAQSSTMTCHSAGTQRKAIHAPASLPLQSVRNGTRRRSSRRYQGRARIMQNSWMPGRLLMRARRSSRIRAPISQHREHCDLRHHICSFNVCRMQRWGFVAPPAEKPAIYWFSCASCASTCSSAAASAARRFGLAVRADRICSRCNSSSCRARSFGPSIFDFASTGAARSACCSSTDFDSQPFDIPPC